MWVPGGGQNAEGGLGLKCRSPRAGWVAIPCGRLFVTTSQRDGGQELSREHAPHNSTNHGAAGPTVQPGVQKVQPIGLDAVIDEQLHQVLQAAALSPVEAKPSL